MPYVPYSTHGFANQDTIYSKLKNETVNLLPVQNPFSKFPNHHEDISAFETAKDLKDTFLAETESRFRPDSTHGLSNQDKNYSKLKNNNVNGVPFRIHISKYPNYYKNVSAFETATDIKDSPYLAETESRFRPDMPNILYHQKNTSKYLNLEKSEPFHESTADNIESALGEIRPFTNGKEILSSEVDHAVDEIELSRNESELITDGFKIPKEIKTKELNQNSKLHVPISQKSGLIQAVSISGDSATEKQHWKYEIQKGRPRMTEQDINSYIKSYQSDRIPGELEYHPQNLVKTFEQPGHIYGKLSSERKGPRQVTKMPSSTLEEEKEFFYVLKCKDCDINHVMIVEEDAADIMPEVETWTFKP
ncbi:hypothetical protein HNY73_003072 [Argiope bruennichi]|uniref:Uncharacterized protein n=1 Tax=Argiope bruennichi TaxID=94029 RepID=A0A8T0FWW1_ARGBR|nr:hypothetical protein HNY73_003072 [Argiope bruennichi]